MKPILAGLIGTVVGAGIGFGAGFIVSKKIQIKRNDEELAKMEAYYKDKYGITEKDILRKKAETPHNAPKIDEKPSEGALKLQKEKFTTFDRIAPVNAPLEDYASKYKVIREEDAEAEDQDFVKDPKDSAMFMTAKEPMTIISPDEYDRDGSYSKTELTYWDLDEMFTDTYGVRVPLEVLAPEDVGKENLMQFGLTGEEGVLYVRDDDNMADYKIYLEESSYDEREKD